MGRLDYAVHIIVKVDLGNWPDSTICVATTTVQSTRSPKRSRPKNLPPTKSNSRPGTTPSSLIFSAHVPVLIHVQLCPGLAPSSAFLLAL